MGRLINVNLEDYNSSGVLGVNEDSIKLSVYSIDENELKSKIIKILLDDPDSDVKKITEDYLIQCLYNATNDPENNPVLFQFFERERQDRMNLWNELKSIRNELKELKEKLGISNYTTEGIDWKNEYRYLEDKLINITEKLGKAGIDINYWEN
jgi:hypothetical protein